MALSSTEAMPVDDLAVGRHDVARLDQVEIVLAQCGGGDDLGFRERGLRHRGAWPRSFLAGVSWRALRSDFGLRLAAALGHRLGEVGEQHGEPQPERNAPMKPVGASPWPSSAWIHNAVVSTLPTSTTNITGLRTIQRGLSLRNESTIARR